MKVEETIPTAGRGRDETSRFPRAREVFLIVGLTLLLAVLLKLFVVDAIHVPSRSMEGTLLAGDYVFVNKLIYGAPAPRLFGPSRASLGHLPGLRSVARGDVIVFELPENATDGRPGEEVYFVKRAIGLPGDMVEIRHGSLIINGEKIEIPPTAARGTGNCSFGPLVVPRRGAEVPLSAATMDLLELVIHHEGHEVSTSPRGDILVDRVPRSTYIVQDDYLFVLGDNLDESSDSRSWGFLPEENVVGRATMVYWSVDGTGHPRWERVGKMIR